jgi:hypothetical protein
MIRLARISESHYTRATPDDVAGIGWMGGLHDRVVAHHHGES